MENKPWLASYPEGIPHEIDTDKYHSVVDLFTEACQSFPLNPAFTNLGHTLSFSDLDRATARFAAWAQHEADLKKGDRIAVMMPNLLQYPVVVFGALRAGLVVVNTNPLYTVRELRHQLNDSGARAIVVSEAFATTVQKVLQDSPLETVVVTRFGDMLPFPNSLLVNTVIKHVKKLVPAWRIDNARPFREVLSRSANLPAVNLDITLDDLAFLQYTGGTTGVAKGAMLTHRNMVSNVQQASAWLSRSGLVPGEEHIVTALPLYHIFALTANCLTFMRLGAENLLITNPRDLPTFIKELKKIRMTAFTGVNTLFNTLLNHPDFAAVDFSGLKMVLGGGMAVQKSVADRWQEVTGTALIEAYGLTETSPAACINPMDTQGFNDSIGLPVPSTDVSIRDPDNNALPFDTPGELCIRGPQVMKGYWQREEDTARAIDADGWFHTGDIAQINARGFVKIVDRLKDMVLVSGFNVYPNEVEGVIAQMDGVIEVGVIGVPDEQSGEAVKAVVVRRDESITAEAIKAYCKDQLTGYKRPKHIQFVEELPKTNVGKILRRELRDL